jgi:uncharacterized membrane protein
MLTLTAILLSLLVVAVHLAMGTFAPRIVRQVPGLAVLAATVLVVCCIGTLV